jgi:trans-aconitate methyltransferase
VISYLEKTLFQKKNKKGLVEWFKAQALSSNLSTAKKKKRKKKTKEFLNLLKPP